MLIWSHFIEEVETELQNYTHWFEEQLHAIYTQQVSEQVALLFSHDELWETCSYKKYATAESA